MDTAIMPGRRLACPCCECAARRVLQVADTSDVTRRLLAETTPAGPSSGGRPTQPDWDQLQNILGSGAAPQSRDEIEQDDLEYFPGRQAGPEGSVDELISSIPETIPVDVMSDLLRIFFQTIHPVWPIVHIPTFFVDLCKWDDHAFAALVVSMCMLASRYSADPRVRSDPSKWEFSVIS